MTILSDDQLSCLFPINYEVDVCGKTSLDLFTLYISLIQQVNRIHGIKCISGTFDHEENISVSHFNTVYTEDL